jgi:multidrug transporter EmrE-like cation transporter
MRSTRVQPPTVDQWRSARASAVSSVFGVAGSVCAKYGLADEWTEFFVDSAIAYCQRSKQPTEIRQPTFDLSGFARELFWFFRVSFILLQLVLNSFMLQHFVRSMHASNSLQAATYNQCFSLLMAGLFGYVCFGESLSLTWLAGSALILAGVGCVQWGSSDQPAGAAVERMPIKRPTEVQDKVGDAMEAEAPAEAASTPRARRSAGKSSAATSTSPRTSDDADARPLRSRSAKKRSAR